MLEWRNVDHYSRKILGRGIVVKEQWEVEGSTRLVYRKYEYRIGKSAEGFCYWHDCSGTYEFYVTYDIISRNGSIGLYMDFFSYRYRYSIYL